MTSSVELNGKNRLSCSAPGLTLRVKAWGGGWDTLTLNLNFPVFAGKRFYFRKETQLSGTGERPEVIEKYLD